MASSLETIAVEARSERNAQLRHFEGLDAKAGVTIGFAGLLVTFSSGTSLLMVAGRSSAILAALIAVTAFLPRRFPTLDLDHLRDVYARTEPAFTQQFLVDATAGFVSRGSKLLQRKANGLRLALGLLAASVLLEGLATIVR